MIVVLDANTWVSALARPMGPSGRVLDAFLEGRFGVATTDHLWNEVLRALSYERVKRLFERGGVASPDARVALLGPLLTRFAEVPSLRASATPPTSPQELAKQGPRPDRAVAEALNLLFKKHALDEVA
jgi:hypothetical protein